MQKQIRITTKGVKSALKKYQYSQSIAEYIWNGFDAQANRIDVKYIANAIGNIESISILDNGYGIPQSKLKDKFEPFFESEKIYEYGSEKNNSTTHGKNGVGRLTFFSFATKAVWNTNYLENSKIWSYSISVDSQAIDKYSGNDEKLVEGKNDKSGTTVTFTGITKISEENMQGDLKDFLMNEFGWFLELNKFKKFAIYINDELLDYSNIVGEKEEFTLIHTLTNTKFDVRYVRWSQKLNNEYSKYYYLTPDKVEKWKEYTTLNNKGDHFYHSLFIESDYFNFFKFNSDEQVNQISLAGGTRSDDQFKYLHQQITNYLRKKRKPFLHLFSSKLIDEYEKDGIFPKYPQNEWSIIRTDDLKNVISELYVVQPKIFNSFNVEQKKTFVRMLDLILESDEREKILEIVKEVVDLDPDERAVLAETLKVTNMTRIINTIKLIEDRYSTVRLLKELVFDKSWGANEVDNIQKIVEGHYWLFGEQYHLVSAAEPKFTEALSRQHYLLTGDKKRIVVDHPDKNKEMDIFLCRQNRNINTVDNIIVELKSPAVKLGEKEVSQVKKYLNVIISQEETNAKNMHWNFYLIGNRFDTSGFIEGEILNSKAHGEESLIFCGPNYKIYAKTWSEVFTEFDCKHEFLNSKLQLQKEKLMPSLENKENIQNLILDNSATLS